MIGTKFLLNNPCNPKARFRTLAQAHQSLEGEKSTTLRDSTVTQPLIAFGKPSQRYSTNLMALADGAD